MQRDARAGRAPARTITILLMGLLLVAALAAGAFALLGAGVRGAPPENLDEAELLRRISVAPENAPDFRATVTVEQTLVPEGLISASEGDGPGASGPRSARIWYGGPEKLRAELQGENGDRVVVKNGPEVSIYDGASNTVRTGEGPESGSPSPEEAASPEEINELLAEISPTSVLRTGPPVEVAGRWAYPLTLEPRDAGSTLVERAEALVDAETYLPLSFELYAEDSPQPVARYEASDFEVGAVPERRFEFETPPGAEVIAAGPEGAPNREDREGRPEEPRVVGSVDEAREAAGFPVRGLAEPIGGRELREIRVAGDAAVLTYGEGWGTVVLAEKPADGDAAAPEASDGDGGADGPGGFEVPTVDLGGGIEAREISTPVGSTLSWSADGVSYSLSGSVPAAELRDAARGLLAG
ncbi:hypothetical protein GBA65_16235 [Rubrobacter marinus]|uniref:DUF4367 domain-containing protein n=1 Tax=Rubrobacter marinus TaxID=2653852 RepID=A0A6G8Q029_9ACTN|nr:hypothetical protein [Rubrobacter marinus]QIN79821.1 hypothetical protein GBA65_16235 [Rubrobacter marinus]